MTIHGAAKAAELCAGLTDDRAKTMVVVGYVARTMLYDHLKARTVRRGYKPDPDATLASRRGICWDFAALVQAMLLAVGVKCRVVIGYADSEYHAWNEVRLDGAWVRYDVTATITGMRYVVYRAEQYDDVTGAIRMTAQEKRELVISQAKPAIGRNKYSQDAAKRECVFTPYKDGKYYSDCSSFVRWLFRRAGFFTSIGSNTVGIMASKLGVEIECKIKNGVPTNISALRVGDLFLFRGNDSSRAASRYVGHVEIVSAVKGDTVTLMGHGSGNPKTHGMKAYCRTRWLTLVANSKIKNRGLICVKRFIADDTDFLSPGDKNEHVTAMQKALLAQGYKLPKYGADGDYGDETKAAVLAFQKARGLTATGIADEKTLALILGTTSPPIAPADPMKPAPSMRGVLVTGSSVNIRSGPGTDYDIVLVASKGMTFPDANPDGWRPLLVNGKLCWISAKYSEAVGKG